MGTPYLGEIRIISFNYPPKGWAFCNGQTLPINQNQALFSLMGTMYGGDGRVNFQLPNLQGRMPVHSGNGFVQGQASGEAIHTLTLPELPAHIHTAQGVSSPASSPAAAGNVLAAALENPYSATANATMNAAAMGTAGGSQPHENMPPYIVLNYVIALVGIFPSRN